MIGPLIGFVRAGDGAGITELDGAAESSDAGSVPRVYHVHLGIEPGSRDAEDRFLVDVLGYVRVPVPRFGDNYFIYETGDGSELHLREDPGHQRRAVSAENGVPDGPHTAIYLDISLTEARDRLSRAGLASSVLRHDDAGDPLVIFTQDPSGNSWELHGPLAVGKQ